MLINIAFYGLLFVLSLFFHQAQHLSPLQIGLAFIPITAAIFMGNIAASRLAHISGVRPVLFIGSTLAVIGIVGLLPLDGQTAFARLVAPFICLGLGLGLIVPLMTSLLLASVDKTLSGVAAGTLSSARQLGSVVGVALFGSLVGRYAIVTGLHIALVISIGLTVGTLALEKYTRIK